MRFREFRAFLIQRGGILARNLRNARTAEPALDANSFASLAIACLLECCRDNTPNFQGFLECSSDGRLPQWPTKRRVRASRKRQNAQPPLQRVRLRRARRRRKLRRKRAPIQHLGKRRPRKRATSGRKERPSARSGRSSEKCETEIWLAAALNRASAPQISRVD